MKKLLFAAALPLLLMGNGGSCGHLNVAKPPPSKLVCANEPAVPAGDATTGAVSDEQDARYKGDLRGAWFDCHSTVDWLRDFFEKLPD